MVKYKPVEIADLLNRTYPLNQPVEVKGLVLSIEKVYDPTIFAMTFGKNELNILVMGNRNYFWNPKQIEKELIYAYRANLPVTVRGKYDFYSGHYVFVKKVEIEKLIEDDRKRRLSLIP